MKAKELRAALEGEYHQQYQTGGSPLCNCPVEEVARNVLLLGEFWDAEVSDELFKRLHKFLVIDIGLSLYQTGSIIDYLYEGLDEVEWKPRIPNT